MDLTQVFMICGFILAAYSVVGNDVIQTLGTFISSNEDRPWYVLWIFSGSILAAVLIYGWATGDIAYGRLDKIDIPATLEWYYVLPPLVLLTITRLGVPVSTTFLILTLFSLHKIEGGPGDIILSVFSGNSVLGKMINKSLMGYLVSFSTALIIYLFISNLLEKRFLSKPMSRSSLNKWRMAQWASTGLLWSQWLTQDLANIYVYLLGPGQLKALPFFLSLLVLIGLLGYIFKSKGGAVQKIVKAKTNTADIRSATIIDFIYAIILYVFKYNYLGLWEAKLPMSTTWVFIGLLAGREIAIRIRLERTVSRSVITDVSRDLIKVFMGLVVSVALVVLIKIIS